MKAVLLANMGAPVSEHEMKTFLKRMFSDKAIIYAPIMVRLIFSFIISNLRYKSSWRKYMQIGGSPLHKSMNATAAALKKLLGNDYLVSCVYSYSHPFIEDKITELYSKGVKDLTVISMYPQASFSTSGSVQNSIDKIQNKYIDMNIEFIEDYFNNDLYIESWSNLIEAEVKEKAYEKPHLLFSAHAIPQSFVNRGDLYPIKLEISAALIAEKLNLPYSLSYQSKIGPVAWTSPYTVHQLTALQAQGVSEIIVVPLSFINENLETGYDLDVELIPYGLNTLGIKNISRVTIPESNPLIVKMFYDFIMQPDEIN